MEWNKKQDKGKGLEEVEMKIPERNQPEQQSMALKRRQA